MEAFEKGQLGDHADEAVVFLAGRSFDFVDAFGHFVPDGQEGVITVETDTGHRFRPSSVMAVLTT